MRIPYSNVAPGVFRPIAAILIRGPAGIWLIDGLLDTGADDTILPLRWAIRLGIDVAQLPAANSVYSATGEEIKCWAVSLNLELRRDEERFAWLGEVAVTTDQVLRPHWGSKGFLEFFRAEFDGANRCVTLVPGDNLPADPS